MKNLNKKQLGSLIKKDILIAKNKSGSLLALYLIYFAIAFFSLREVKTLLTLSQGNFKTLFAVLFLFQTSFIIAFILFPQFIYKESMKEKHEIYFAYQFNILEIVIAKSLILTSLGLLPGYLLLLVLFYSLLEFSAPFIFCIFLIIPLISFVIIAFNVLFSWFTKSGRIISTGFLLIFIFLFTQIRKIIKPSVNITFGYINLVLLGITIILMTGIILISLAISKERCILKN